MTRREVSRSYVVLGALLLIVLTVQTLNRQWSTDWYLHAASVRELAAHPFHPHHPTVGTSAADPEFSPYLLALGLIVKGTGLSVLAVLSIAGLLNAVLFIVAFWLVVRLFTTARQAPTWALLFVLVMWGVSPWRWSGYPDLNSIGFGLPYPSMAALVMVLFGLVAVDAWCRRPRLAVAVIAFVLGALAALTHPPTTVPAAVAVAAIVVWRWRRELTASWWHLAIAGALGAVIVATWPLYRWFALASRSGAYDVQNRGTYSGFVPRVLLLLVVAIPILFLRWRRNRRDPLVLMFVGGLAVFALGRIAGRETLGRTLPFAALGGQIAVADVVATRIKRGDERFLLGGIVIVVLGVAGCAAVLPRFVPRPLLPASIGDRAALRPLTSGYEFLTLVPRDDVVAVQDPRSAEAEPTFGGKEVAPGYPAAFVEDSTQRAHDNNEIFSTPDAAQRATLIRRYHVRWILMRAPYADNPAHAPMMALGEVVHRDPSLVLLRLR